MNGQPWTKKDLSILRARYPEMATWKLTKELNRSESAIYGQAHSLGLRKSQAFLQSPMELNRAKAISSAAQAIINSAKVEVDFLRVTGGLEGSGFIPYEPRKPLPDK